MSNVGALIEQTRRHLFGAHKPQLNKLASALSQSATTITASYNLNGAVAGSTLCIDDELVYVWEATPANKQLIIERGWLGTTPAAHDAGALIEVNPRYSVPVIRQALQDELRSWPPELFRVEAQDIPVASNTRLIDLTTFGPIIQVLRITRPPSSNETAWRRVSHRFERTTSDEYPSGVAVLPQAIGEAVTVRVAVAKPFAVETFSDNVDLITQVGLAESMLDIAPLGAASRLLAVKEIQRVDMSAQGDPRIATEVQGGTITATSRQLRALRDKRFAEEALRLRNAYPWTM
jgi:hypothetical protein